LLVGRADMAALGINRASGVRYAERGATVGGAPCVEDTRGAVMSEHVLLLGAVCLTAAAAVAGIGPPLLHSFHRARATLVAPFP
jgi:hypothetical protein